MSNLRFDVLKMRSRGFGVVALLLWFFGDSVYSQMPKLLSEKEVGFDFREFCGFVRGNYCYFDTKATDWEAVERLFLPRALAARNVHELVPVLEAALDELYDPHSKLEMHLPGSFHETPYDICAERRGTNALILEVFPNSPAARAGLHRGQEILRVNGKTIEERMKERLPKTLRHADQAAERWALSAVLAGQYYTNRSLMIWDGTKQATVRLDDVNQQDPLWMWSVQSKRLTNQIGYIHIGIFLGDHVVKDFDRALEDLRDAPGLILDVRNNPGGEPSVAHPIIGRFIKTMQPAGISLKRDQSGRRWIPHLFWVEPRGPWTFTGPVVVLVNHFTGSMAEGFTMTMDGINRAKIIGTQMKGLGASTTLTVLKNSEIPVRVSNEPLFHINGIPREDFSPADPVDLMKNEGVADPILEAGVATLLHEVAEAKTLARKH